MSSSGGAFIVPANLPVPVASAGALTPYNVANYGFDAQGNDVNAGPWANLLADIRTKSPRAAKIVFPAGDFSLPALTIDATTLLYNGSLIIEGQGDQTRLFPGGGQGRCLTIKCNGGQIEPVIRNLRLGYGPELASVDQPYSQPLLEIQGGAGYLIEKVSYYTAGTGAGIKLNSTFEGEIRNCHFDTGQYGIPFVWTNEANPGTQPDTVIGRNILIRGNYGFVFNYANQIEVIKLDGYKAVAPEPVAQAAFESYLAADAAAGANTITLHAGDGASFAVNDSIAIGEGQLGTAGMGFEVNKVAGIAGDVLTLQWPLQYAHTAAHHTQVIRGGVGLVMPFLANHKVCDSHFEAYDTGILVWNGTGLELDNNTQQCNRYVRVAGGATDIRLGTTEALGTQQLGAPFTGQNILVDVPSWSTALTQSPRVRFDGPFLGAQSQITVNYQGTSFNVDSQGWHTLTPGASFAAGGFSTPGVKIDSTGLRFRGLLTMAGAVAANSTVTALPLALTPHRSALLTVYQTNTQNTSATPAANAVWVQGSDQGANSGLVTMRVASTAAGWLSLDSLPPITVH